VIVCALLLAPGAAASQAGLVVSPAPGGCFGQSTGLRHCTPVRGGMDRSSAVALSPDGRYVYVFGTHGGYAAPGSVGMVAVFAREQRTDALRQLPGPEGCIGEIAGCAPVTMGKPTEELGSTAQALIVTADARNVYVAAYDRIVVFARDSSTGVLTQLPGALGCVSDASSPGSCTPARAVGLAALAISPDGADLYSAGGSAVSALRRDPVTGALKQLPGSDQCADADGSEGCAVSGSLRIATGVAVSPDGRSVYVTSLGTAFEGEGAVSVFARDPVTGGIGQLAGASGCLSVNPSLSGPECARSAYADSPASVLVSPDGREAYVALGGIAAPTGESAKGRSLLPAALVEFARDSSTGALQEASCGALHPCAPERVIPSVFALAIAPSGRRLAVGSIETPGAAAFFGTGNMVSTFDRNTTTGALAQPRGAGCITDVTASLESPASVRGCTLDRAFSGVAGLALSPDGEAAYTAGGDIQVLITPIVAIPPQPLSLHRSRTARIRVACLAGGGRCTGRLRLQSARRLRLGHGSAPVSLGAARFSIRAGKSQTLTVRLPSPPVRGLLNRGIHRLRVLVTATASRDGHTHPAQASLLLGL